MSAIRARVRNGRLQLDETTALPEGTVLDLVADDEGDDLDQAERAARDQIISRSLSSLEAGRGRPMRELVEELRRR